MESTGRGARTKDRQTRVHGHTDRQTAMLHGRAASVAVRTDAQDSARLGVAALLSKILPTRVHVLSLFLSVHLSLPFALPCPSRVPLQRVLKTRTHDAAEDELERAGLEHLLEQDLLLAGRRPLRHRRAQTEGAAEGTEGTEGTEGAEGTEGNEGTKGTRGQGRG